MSPRLMGRTAFIALVSGLAIAPRPAAAQGTLEDYRRGAEVSDRLRGLTVDIAGDPNWIGESNRFWYRKSVTGGNEFVLVDAAAARKAPAFDHTRVARALSSATGESYTAVTLPFSTFTFVNSEQAIEVTAEGSRWRCGLADDQCTRLGAAEEGAGRGGRGGRAGGGGGRGRGAGEGGATEPQVRVSPDGRTEAFIQNFNVAVRPVGGGDMKLLSRDGSEGNAYELGSIVWSPDSRKLVAYRTIPGYRRMVHYIESSPSDQLQPKSSEIFYRKPGDVLDKDQPVLFLLDQNRRIEISDELFPNAYSLSRPEWRDDSRAFTMEYNQRGHQLYRVIEVNATDGAARSVVSEEPETFFYYRNASGGLTDSGSRYRLDIDDGREIIWMSERDGWTHLYLYDGVTGRVKNQITKGEWVVRAVDSVDVANRQIYFRGAGMNRGQDPYFTHYYRINFDGTGLVAYTEADGNHELFWSPDRQYYVDRWSRVDLAPVAQLRRASDRRVVLELEKGDFSAQLETGWRPPEVFVAKGRDGSTDIWGIIVRPTNFDPSKKYPVIEQIYAGPQGSFVPKSFSPMSGLQPLAELGFIVVQIDGMGTASRSKAFHDVAWKNLGDAGFPDRILWHKAVAAKYPWYDVTRVGLYGTSAGGQNALGGLLFHPEFYDAAVAAAGCHDNRMDKIWWNELWMSWPIGPQYEASSNVVHASNLQGKLLLVVGEMDNNVDPASTLQVVNALINSNKYFDMLFIPGAGHTSGGAYGTRKRYDFFVQNLLGVTPPAWNTGVTVDGTPVGQGLDFPDDWQHEPDFFDRPDELPPRGE